jgi:hypothetical protein
MGRAWRERQRDKGQSHQPRQCQPPHVCPQALHRSSDGSPRTYVPLHLISLSSRGPALIWIKRRCYCC